MPNSIDTVAPVSNPLKAKKPPYELKIALDAITPKYVEGPPNEELMAMHRHLHQLWRTHFSGNKFPEHEGINRMQLATAHAAIALELKERGFKHDQPIRMMKAQKHSLETQAPRGEKLFTRGVRMLVHSDMNGYPTGQPIVVVQNGQAIGEIRLTRPFEFDQSEFDSMGNVHGLPPQPAIQNATGTNKKLYGFGVVIHRKYDMPKKVGADRKMISENV